MPHEGLPFTQGLEISADGQHLVESSGSYPPGTVSYVRLVDPKTGATIKKLTEGLEHRFAEGLVQHGSDGHWMMSTYSDKEAVEYDPEMGFVKHHKFPWMGWGLTRTPDGSSFLATNGSEYVMTMSKGSFDLVDNKVVSCLGKRVSGLNELEMVDDFLGLGPMLLGNVYLTRVALVLDPHTARCIGVFHLEGLGDTQPNEGSGFHVANGLAYNRSSGTLFVTGKNWDKMFEVRITEDPSDYAKTLLSRHLQRALTDSTVERAFSLSASGTSTLEMR